MSLSKRQETVKDREAWRAAVQQKQIGLSNWAATYICTPPSHPARSSQLSSLCYSRFPPASWFTHGGVRIYMYVSPNPPIHPIPPPHPLVHMSIFYPCISESPENRFICTTFYIPHVWVNICDLLFSFWLTEMDKLKNPQRIWQLPRPQNNTLPRRLTKKHWTLMHLSFFAWYTLGPLIFPSYLWRRETFSHTHTHTGFTRKIHIGVQLLELPLSLTSQILETCMDSERQH